MLPEKGGSGFKSGVTPEGRGRSAVGLALESVQGPPWAPCGPCVGPELRARARLHESSEPHFPLGALSAGSPVSEGPGDLPSM